MVAQSPEPGAHVLNARAFRIELEFRNVGFCGEGKTGVPREKPLGAEKRTNNKLNPHMTSSPGIEPGPHWWKASALTTALTTAPSLLPLLNVTLHFRDSCVAASLHPKSRTPKSPFLCVKGSPIRYDFRGSAKAFRYSVNIANFVRQI